MSSISSLRYLVDRDAVIFHAVCSFLWNCLMGIEKIAKPWTVFLCTAWGTRLYRTQLSKFLSSHIGKSWWRACLWGFIAIINDLYMSLNYQNWIVYLGIIWWLTVVCIFIRGGGWPYSGIVISQMFWKTKSSHSIWRMVSKCRRSLKAHMFILCIQPR